MKPINSNQLTKKIIEKSILHTTLVDKTVRVVDHTDQKLISAHGKITKETKNTITISLFSSKKSIIIEKKSGRFEFYIGEQVIMINGKLLVGLIDRRKKRKIRNW